MDNETLKKIADDWFLTEPALFAAHCTFPIAENNAMRCMARINKGTVEISTAKLASMSYKEAEERLRVEYIRILLKHPFERKPTGLLPASPSLASDAVIVSNYQLKHTNAIAPEEYNEPRGESFEHYCRSIDNILRSFKALDLSASADLERDTSSGNKNEETLQKDGDSTADSDNNVIQNKENNGQEEESTKSDSQPDGINDSDDDNGDIGDEMPDSATQENEQEKPISQKAENEAADNAEGWEEDSLMQEKVNSLIMEIANADNWGSLAGNMEAFIKATLEVKMDYRKVLSAFRTSVISSHRHLTRMRPNRRTGFEQMGSIYELRTQLLVATDCSGSIDDKALSAFYSAINRFFKYGTEEIDVVQFDVKIQDISTLKRNRTDIKVNGRGGTDPQCVFDHVKQNNHYDGIIFFTDGFFAPPIIDFKLKAKVLWILNNKTNYAQSHQMLEETGRTCWIEY